MKYNRKTTDKWKYSVSLVTNVVLATTLIMSGVQNSQLSGKVGHLALQVQAQDQKEVSIAEQYSGFSKLIKEVEKEVIVYETPESIEDKIRAVFVEDPDTAVKVARCESGLRPDAKSNISSARGLFQVLSYLHGVNERFLYNPDVNIQIAHQLYTESNGWGPWEASKHCWSK